MENAKITVIRDVRTGKYLYLPFKLRNKFEQRNSRLRARFTAYARSIDFKAFVTLTFDEKHLPEFSQTGKEISQFIQTIRKYPRCVHRIRKLAVRGKQKTNRKTKSLNPLAAPVSKEGVPPAGGGDLLLAQDKPKLMYAWKYEEGEQHSRPHYHLLLSLPVPKCAIKVWGRGFVKFQRISSSLMACKYVSKYMSKGTYAKFLKRGSRVSGSNIHCEPARDFRLMGNFTPEELQAWMEGDPKTLEPYVLNRKV